MYIATDSMGLMRFPERVLVNHAGLQAGRSYLPFLHHCLLSRTYLLLTGVYLGNDGTADVVPHRKDCAGDGGHGIHGKVDGSQ